MIRRLAALSLLLFATAAQAQQARQATPAERTRLATLGSALGRCHHGIVLRDARTQFTAAQIADRAIAACARREAPIRAELVRQIGPQRTQAVMQGQRAHWRQAIGQMVAQARGAR
jgi:hypothetical protein